MLTEKEKKILRLLIASPGIDYSINQIAKECSLAPNGAYKILSKFEKQGILEPKAIANIKSYHINFENAKTALILELALIPAIEGKVKYRLNDLAQLKDVTKACILFGSYIEPKKDPNDMDVLFMIDKKDYKEYKKKLREAVVPVKIHDVVQTQSDLLANIKRKDNVVLDILKKGIVLWGQREIVEVAKNAKQD